MRMIRWVGHPSPFDDPDIQRLLMAQKIRPPMVESFRRFEHNRRISVQIGKSEFYVGPDHGMSRSYKWGPYLFDVEMEDEDWDRLQRHPVDAYMFLDVTNDPSKRRQMSKRDWQVLIHAAETSRPPKVMTSYS